MDQARHTIVAEVSKSWPETEFTRDHGRSIGNIFEEVININRQRGYCLKEWQLSTVMHSPDHLIETIIAIFELTVENKPTPSNHEVRCTVLS